MNTKTNPLVEAMFVKLGQDLAVAIDNLRLPSDQSCKHLELAASIGPKHQTTDLPDVSLNMDHLIVLLQAAFEQLESSRPTPRQIEIATWLLSDALSEARDIYQLLYEPKPLEEDA